MRDVAREANVSSAVVSFVLNGRANRSNPASPAVEERVLAAAEKLGYSPDLNARSLRLRRTERICLVVGRPGNPSADLLLAGLQKEAHQRGYSTLMLPVDADGNSRRSLELLRQGLADGAVLGPMPRTYPLVAAEIADLVRRGVAIVALGDELPSGQVDVVRGKEQEAAAAAVGALVAAGRRRIAYLAHADDLVSGGSPRYRGYLEALRAAGLATCPDLVVVGAAEDRVAAYRAATGLLSLPQPPDAIFSGSDRGAVSAIWALRDAGVTIPEQVAVLGFGNLPEGEVVRPALSTIGQGTGRFHEVADLLFARIDGDSSPAKEVVIPALVHWRESAVPHQESTRRERGEGRHRAVAATSAQKRRHSRNKGGH